jgi:hypothetical protein
LTTAANTIYNAPNQRGVCMKGNIYVTHKCSCGGNYQYLEHRGGCFCKECDHRAEYGFMVSFGGGKKRLQKRFKYDFYLAQRQLTRWRSEEDDGTFDYRDYRASRPLSFKTVAEQWLEWKRTKVSYHTWYSYKANASRAIRYFGDVNIKSINEGTLDDFLEAYRDKLSGKTLHHTKSILHQIFKWACRHDKKIPMPDFPTVGYESEYKKIIDIDTQQAVVAELQRIAPAKVWWGIKILSENPRVRPGELRNIKHSDILDGVIHIRKTKERVGKGKFILLEPDDIAFLRSLPPTIGDVDFFLHETGSWMGKKYSCEYFNKWWKKACSNLGVTGVCVYAGTKHSTVTAVSKILSPEQIRRGGTGHSTGSSFERYLVPDVSEQREFKRAVKVAQGKVVKLKTGS